jgi:hypothetical protein
MDTSTDIEITGLTPQLQLSGVAKELAASLGSVNRMSEQIAAQRPFAKWAEEQQQSFSTIQRALVGTVGKPGAFGAAAAIAAANKPGTAGAAAAFAKRSNLGSIGLSAKHTGVSAALAKSLVGFTPPRYPSALSKALIEPSTRYSDLARALAPSLRSYRSTTGGASVAPALSSFLRKQRFTFPDVIAAGKDAAALIEEQGAHQEAEAVREIVFAVAEVAATPTTSTVERLATALSAQFEAASARVSEVGSSVEKLAERVDENEQRRQSDRNVDTALAVFLCYLTLMFEIVRLLLEVAAKGQ